MIYDMILVFLAFIGGFAVSAVAVFYGLKVSDAVRAHLWARKQAKKPPAALQPPIQVYLSLGGRLEARSREAQAIEDARQMARQRMDRQAGTLRPRPEDYDIETILRQIGEQN